MRSTGQLKGATSRLQRFLEDDRFREDDFRRDEDDFLRGTLPPARRASDSPIAIACFRLVTFLPDRPLFSVPRFRSCIAFSTFCDAFLPYFAIGSSLNASMPFEELDGTLMSRRRRAGRERSQIASLACRGILLAGIEAVLARFELSNHRLPSSCLSRSRTARVKLSHRRHGARVRATDSSTRSGRRNRRRGSSPG